jgi:translation initiation factor 1 (eIF-1/SUI1)
MRENGRLTSKNYFEKKNLVYGGEVQKGIIYIQGLKNRTICLELLNQNE